MHRGIHRANRRAYTVEDYVAAFGPRLDKNGQPNSRPIVECVSCSHPMHTVGETGPLRDATWAHNPTRPPLWCPLKDNDGGKYALLMPVAPNIAAGAALRASFFVNWRLHWAHILEIVPMCDIFTLIGYVRDCDARRFWEQAGLEEWFIPYIFLATCDFPPPKSKTGAVVRTEWIRCRFDARVRTPQDVWIRAAGPWGFTKARYRLPARGAQPGPSHLIAVDAVVPDAAFLTRVAPGANVFQVNAMQKAFPVECP
jgi:hypothetical protein